MKQFLIESKFILLFFVLLTGATVFSNFDSETQPASSGPELRQLFGQKTPAMPPGPELPADAGRSPAAVNPAGLNDGPPTAALAGSLTLKKEFLCHRIGPALRDRVADRLVMINFRMCRTLTNVRDVLLENQSNGFKAQIFRMADSSFKTDYIQLSEGLNRLRFEVVLKDGQKYEESLEILSGS